MRIKIDGESIFFADRKTKRLRRRMGRTIRRGGFMCGFECRRMRVKAKTLKKYGWVFLHNTELNRVLIRENGAR